MPIHHTGARRASPPCRQPMVYNKEAASRHWPSFFSPCSPSPHLSWAGPRTTARSISRRAATALPYCSSSSSPMPSSLPRNSCICANQSWCWLLRVSFGWWWVSVLCCSASRALSLRGIFWLTGLLGFFISAVADNLTTALIMAAVVLAVGVGHPRFVAVSCINIVVAAIAGGAFSPFGDITTLLVWQSGLGDFWGFFHLFVPSLVDWLVPAFIMSFAVAKTHPAPMTEHIVVKQGGYLIVVLFFLTIVMAVAFHNFLHFPPVVGMMTGLGLLKLYGYRLRQAELAVQDATGPSLLVFYEVLLRYF